MTSALKPGEYYTQETVKEVVQYAKERGIRVIPEMDIPYDSSHMYTKLGLNEGTKMFCVLCVLSFLQRTCTWDEGAERQGTAVL